MNTLNAKRPKRASSLAANIFIFALLPTCVLFFRISALFPAAVERFYSQGLFLKITQIQYIITRRFDFAVGEIVMDIFILYLLIKIILSFRALFGKRIAFKLFVRRFIKGFFFYAGIVYFLFMLFWGLNYHRKPLLELLLKPVDSAHSDISPQELSECTSVIMTRANKLSFAVNRNESGIFYLSERTRAAITLQAKPYMFSALMSKAGISGFYFPFTGEPVYNRHIVDVSLPFTIAHEYAHRLGFARENEANAAAYLLCLRAASPEIRYSAELTALTYLLSALRRNDETLFDKYYALADKSVKTDMRHRAAFWKNHQGIFNDVSDRFNDLFLKANMQRDGRKSYGRFVELLVILHREEMLADVYAE